MAQTSSYPRALFLCRARQFRPDPALRSRLPEYFASDQLQKALDPQIRFLDIPYTADRFLVAQ
jgi:hypothetical protein